VTSKPWILFDIGGVFALADDGVWQKRFSLGLRDLSGLDDDQFGACVDAADLPRIDIESGVDHQGSLDGAAQAGIRGILHTDNTTTIAAIEDFLATYG
jgi:hypothetical protein